MKKLVRLVPEVGIAGGLLLLSAYLFYVNFWFEEVVVPSPVGEIREQQITLTTLEDAKPIQLDRLTEPIIKVGERHIIDFLVDKQELGSNPMDREDKLRDWLMLAVLSRSELEQTIRQKAMAEVSSDRGGQAKSVPHGDAVRSIRLVEVSEGRALVLAPKVTDPERQITVAQVADELMWKRHHRAREIDLYEYDLMPEKMLAHVIRIGPIAEKDLYSNRYGFRDGRISSREELDAFLSTVDDVVALMPLGEPQECRLWIGGRRLPGRTQTGMPPGEVTLVWAAYARAAGIWKHYLLDRQAKDEELQEWCRERRGDYLSKWDMIRKESPPEEDRTSWLRWRPTQTDSAIALKQSQANSEAKSLSSEMLQRANSVRSQLASKEQEAGRAMQECVNSLPVSALLAWRKMTIRE